jgi:hypothetical protein
MRPLHGAAFHGKYIPEPNSGCWLWLGAITNHGYGVLKEAQKQWPAHRYAWTLTYGPIPEGLQVLHRCDVRCCVNPSHLFLGAHADNMTDMVVKGRSRSHPGESQWQSKLTAEEVLAIRADMRPHPTIARDYGVRSTTVWKIKHRTRWRHVP